MMRQGQSAVYGAGLVMAVALCLISVPARSQSTEGVQIKPALSSLGYFSGDWECAGKFDSSGKTIEAHQHFAPELDGAWISFRHDDKPPFGYHSLAEWGWDATRKEFIMIAQDSTGGVRVFRSSGWNSTQLQWDGDALGSSSAPSQRFTFERLDDRHFKVSYFTLKGGDWSRMDSSTCNKQ
jgi:hypothetical protein